MDRFPLSVQPICVRAGLGSVQLICLILAEIVDELFALSRAIAGLGQINHDPCYYFFQTGNQLPAPPIYGSLDDYGLGSDNQKPTFFIILGFQKCRARITALFPDFWWKWISTFRINQGISVSVRQRTKVLLLTLGIPETLRGTGRPTAKCLNLTSNHWIEAVWYLWWILKISAPNRPIRDGLSECNFRTLKLRICPNEPRLVLWVVWGKRAAIPRTYAANCILSQESSSKQDCQFASIYSSGDGIITEILPNGIKKPMVRKLDRATAALIKDSEAAGLLEGHVGRLGWRIWQDSLQSGHAIFLIIIVGITP